MNFLDKLKQKQLEGRDAKSQRIAAEVDKHVAGIEEKLLQAAFNQETSVTISTDLKWTVSQKESDPNLKLFCEVAQGVHAKLVSLVQDSRVKLRSKSHGSVYGYECDKSDTVDFVVDLKNLEAVYR